MHILFWFPVPPTTINITTQPVEARAGHQLRLTCVCSSSNPPAVITWVHSSQHMPGTSLGHDNAEFGGKSSKNVLEFIPTAADHNTA